MARFTHYTVWHSLVKGDPSSPDNQRHGSSDSLSAIMKAGTAAGHYMYGLPSMAGTAAGHYMYGLPSMAGTAAGHYKDCVPVVLLL
ncbi:MAG: hypothetical protein M1319_00315 [Chloroflexi bacterium]|nr:hypothetical protein [Chloroflexota bacterium]